jgi:uncharacterized membrane protein YhaH (DUF805 family)
MLKMHEFFSNEGRLNRLPYFIRGSILGGLQRILFIVLSDPSQAHGFVFRSLLFVFLVAGATLILLQVIKRLHDMDHSGWYTLLLLVPIVNIALGLFLTFKKGTVGPNSFGTDPVAAGTIF